LGHTGHAAQRRHHGGHNETRHRQEARTTRNQVEEYGQTEAQDRRTVGHRCRRGSSLPDASASAQEVVRRTVTIGPIQKGQQLEGRGPHQGGTRHQGRTRHQGGTLG